MKRTITEIVVAPVITDESNAAATVSQAQVFACAVPALLLATACLLPYLNKPFLVDDSLFLAMARQIVKHPIHPMDFDLCWNTLDNCTKAYAVAPGNALMGYLLVPTVLTGAHEWMAHLTQLVLVWIAVLAMTSLVFRLGWDRWHATAGALLLVAIPPFLPMASTAIPDILATLLAVVGIERLAAWKAEQKWYQGTAAALALGLAGYARSHLALLLPLAVFFLLDSLNPREILRQIRNKWWLWSPVIAGSLLLLLLIIAVREQNLAINPPSSVLIPEHRRNNFYAFFLYFAFPLPFAVCWLVNRVIAGRRLRVVFILGEAVAAWLLASSLALVLFFALAGLGAVIDVLIEQLRRREHIGFFLMLWTLVPLPIVLYTHLPMKYLLPCVPAVILLCFRLLRDVPLRVARAITILLIIGSTGYSLLILHSDAEFANFGRQALYRLIEPRIAAGEKVWYPGQYWSYWYAPLAGAKLTFPGGPQPQPGDLLVVDEMAAAGNSPLKRFPNRTLVQSIHHKYRFGRTMGAGKGLYSNGFGFWLWGFGESDGDVVELWRID